MSEQRPTYRKVNRKTGGFKECPNPGCAQKHKPTMRIGGRVQRPKACIKCGAPLPRTLTYPKRSRVHWFVRESDPATGQEKDHPAKSGEHADDMIRDFEAAWTCDPVRKQLIASVVARCHEVQANTLDAAIDDLIVKLGGDPSRRSLVPIGWQEAVDTVCQDMRQAGKSESYVDDIRRVVRNLNAATGVSNWMAVDLRLVKEYRRLRMAGGWKLDGKKTRAVGRRAWNKDFGTLSAFLSRAVANNWIAANPLTTVAARDEIAKLDRPRVPYMSDEVLQAILQAAKPVWLRAMIVLAYYTGARKPDLLGLEWARDIDLDGEKDDEYGVTGPKIWIAGNKAATPHWMPLSGPAVAALRLLRSMPTVDPLVFPVRPSRHKGQYVSAAWREACNKAKGALPDGQRTAPGGEEWQFKHLRKKANTDFRNAGASPKEREAFLGHSTSDINEKHYEGLQPERLRKIVDSLTAFSIQSA